MLKPSFFFAICTPIHIGHYDYGNTLKYICQCLTKWRNFILSQIHKTFGLETGDWNRTRSSHSHPHSHWWIPYPFSQGGKNLIQLLNIKSIEVSYFVKYIHEVIDLLTSILNISLTAVYAACALVILLESRISLQNMNIREHRYCLFID